MLLCISASQIGYQSVPLMELHDPRLRRASLDFLVRGKS
jgi:hypothetical protein